jgi:hypothetical protein
MNVMKAPKRTQAAQKRVKARMKKVLEADNTEGGGRERVLDGCVEMFSFVLFLYIASPKNSKFHSCIIITKKDSIAMTAQTKFYKGINNMHG